MAAGRARVGEPLAVLGQGMPNYLVKVRLGKDLSSITRTALM